MERTTIRGNSALAQKLGVSRETVQEWRKEGVLAPATLVEFRRVIIYDLDLVYECLRNRPKRQGRQKEFRR